MGILSQRSGHAHRASKLKESSSTAFNTFETEVLNNLYQLSLHSKPGSLEEIYTFSWIQTSLHILPNIDRSFAKFIAEIDYPVTKWKTFHAEEYLKGNLSLLDHFNCISSSLNHMSLACMELLHALSLAKSSVPAMLKNLKEIQVWGTKKTFEEDQEQEKVCSEKEMMVYKALLIRNHVKNWVCRIVDSSIRGDGGGIVHELGGVCNSSLIKFKFSVCEGMKKKGFVKEVGDINRGVMRLFVAGTEGDYREEIMEVTERVEVLGKMLQMVKEDVNKLFSDSMVKRDELINSFEQCKH
ncbi:hypothetical protein ACHQM5_018973 [Ranunculus cassubicifolius]